MHSIIQVAKLKGNAYEAGKLYGEKYHKEIKSQYIRFWNLNKKNSFQNTYFRRNIDFTAREFPKVIELIEGFSDGAGITLDEGYFCHIYSSLIEGCSVLGIISREDGPVMLRTMDSGTEEDCIDYISKTCGIHMCCDSGINFVSVGVAANMLPTTSINEKGLICGASSGNPTCFFSSNSDSINIYLVLLLITWACSDCADVRHFLSQYNFSGVKGMNLVVIDCHGNMLGIELAPGNVCFREPKNGFIYEVNHYQHTELYKAGYEKNPSFYISQYYMNSLNRGMFLEYFRDEISKLSTINEIREFFFRQYPGQIIQYPQYNIGNWYSDYAAFVDQNRKCLLYHQYPCKKEIYQSIYLD